jgi:hypothetical protein
VVNRYPENGHYSLVGSVLEDEVNLTSSVTADQASKPGGRSSGRQVWVELVGRFQDYKVLGGE